ncbi:MAG TPA: hypothetical protein VMG12_08590 [Polyangiaceae bacterium]|nr:hypothetical protein [Polyangiaceae bacterium]
MQASSIGAGILGTALFLGAAVSAAAEPAPTCLFAPLVPHRVDATLQQGDVSAPPTPVVVSVDAFRRNGMTCTHASCVANSCGSTGTVRIDLAPSADDATPPAELGYRLVLVRGALPESMQSSIGVPLAAGHVLYLRPGFDELPLLDVELAAVAIDAAGNESAPTEPFPVRFDGCTLAAVGDRCEDELDADADLSTVLDEQLGGVASDEAGSGDSGSEPPPGFDTDAELASGASCALGSTPRPVSAFVGTVLALLGAFAARRRTQCVKTVPHRH